MGRYEDFWQITQDGLVFACRSLGLAPTHDQIEHLMQAYLTLSPFPEIAAALEALGGVPCSILSNGTPKMLDSVVRNAGLEGRFQHVLSVDQVRTYKPTPSRLSIGREPAWASGVRRSGLFHRTAGTWPVEKHSASRHFGSIGRMHRLRCWAFSRIGSSTRRWNSRRSWDEG